MTTATLPDYLARLDGFQLKAATHPLGTPSITVAGAGSGKTSLYTSRVNWLLDQGINPRSIVAITFTNKAAQEIRHRLGFGDDPKVGPRVSTIHALALNAIRIDPVGFGLSKRISTLDDGEAYDLIRRLLEGHKKDSKFADVNVANVIEKIGYHRARGVGFRVDYTPEVHAAAEKAHGGYHALQDTDLILWEEFEKAKTQSSVIDFNDMLYLVVRRGATDPVWVERIQRQFKVVMVDEAQDCSKVQWDFINTLLAPDNHNLMTVGDLSQSIYAFNGAAPDILGGMVVRWRDTEPTLYKLENNYRSCGKIVKWANRIQSFMKDTVPLTMIPRREEMDPSNVGKVAMLRNDTGRSLAGDVGDIITRDNRLKTGKLKFKDNAILVRSASQISDIEGELVRRRIPYIIRGGRSLLQSEEAKDILAYLKLVVNPGDVTAFARAVATPKRGVGDAAVERLRKAAEKSHDNNLVAACADSKHNTLIPFGSFLKELTECPDAVAAFDKVVREVRYRDIIRDRYKKDEELVQKKLTNLDSIREAIEALVHDGTNPSLADVVFRITLNPKDEAEKEEGAVTISTIHAAKGLEWPRVFVTNVIEGSIPHRWSRTEAELEEDRRLFYVACTRAREELFVCVQSMVQRGPNVAKVKPSRFLVELGVVSHADYDG